MLSFVFAVALGNEGLPNREGPKPREIGGGRSVGVFFGGGVRDQVLLPFGYFGYQGFGPPRPLIW